MRGLVEEATHQIWEHDSKGPILDLVIVASMQRIEHYGIAAYGTDVALAKTPSEKELIEVLTLTPEDEKQTDLKLTEVTEQLITPAAMSESEAGACGSDSAAPFRRLASSLT
jgi:ferritin-like metal-binding protein YciE